MPVLATESLTVRIDLAEKTSFERYAKLGDVIEGCSRYAGGANTSWDLVAYDGRGGTLLGRYPIERAQFIRVRELFDYGDDEWFADAYEVRPELWPQVIQMLSCPPPEPGRAYFIEGSRTDH